jgi:hypothetical protein
MMTADDLQALLSQRDWRLRLRPVATRRWMRCALACWVEPWDNEADWLANWKRRARYCYEERVGNPMVWLWLLGIVVNLIWQWWLHHRDNDAMAALKTECCRD